LEVRRLKLLTASLPQSRPLRDSLVVSVLDLRSRGRGWGNAGRGWSRSNLPPLFYVVSLFVSENHCLRGHLSFSEGGFRDKFKQAFLTPFLITYAQGSLY